MSTTSTDRTFNDMLNEYLPTGLLKEEFVRRDYLLSKIEKDNSWMGGTLIVPFRSAGASSVKFGNLTGATDIAQETDIRGSISAPVEVWGSLFFHERDLMEHDKISEQNLLRILPDQIEDFMDYMKTRVSMNLLNGSHFDTITDATSSASGLFTVSRPEKYSIGQKVTLDDGSDNDDAYVTAVNMETKVVTFSLTRGGAAGDFNAVGHDSTDTKIYEDSADEVSFTSLRKSLLSAANGGDTTLYGQTKVTSPYTQAINVSGASVTAANIMEEIFDALTEVRQRGKGNPTDVVMSYKNLGSVLKAIELSKGAFNVSPGSNKASQFGWTEIEIGSVKGSLKLVGVNEMDDDVIYFLDWRALAFHSNGFFQKRKSPDGIQFYETRNATGYTYIVDVKLFGELVVRRPSYCGVMHSISY
jgi:hypothetical protein